MLWLVGQILLFVLVALVVGAALGALLFAGPLRRQVREARRRFAEASSRATAAERERDAALAASDRAAETAQLAARLVDVERDLAAVRERGTGDSADTVVVAVSPQPAPEPVPAPAAEPAPAAISPVAEPVPASVPPAARAEDDEPVDQDELQFLDEDDEHDADADGLRPAPRPESEELAGLRARLAAAEERAAKFSSRLAMARAESEEPERRMAMLAAQVARREAEWLRERTGLVARLAAAEKASEPEPEPTPEPQPMPASPAESRPAARTGGTVDALDAMPAAHRNGVHPAAVASASAPSLASAPNRVPAVEPEPPRVPAVEPAPAPARVPAAARNGWAPVLTGGRALDDPDSPLGTGPLRIPGTGDNLRDIVGIGPVVHRVLLGQGIRTYLQVAVISEDDRRRLNESLSTVAEHIDWDDWSEQAQALHVRKYGDADRV